MSALDAFHAEQTSLEAMLLEEATSTRSSGSFAVRVRTDADIDPYGRGYWQVEAWDSEYQRWWAVDSGDLLRMVPIAARLRREALR